MRSFSCKSRAFYGAAVLCLDEPNVQAYSRREAAHHLPMELLRSRPGDQ